MLLVSGAAHPPSAIVMMGRYADSPMCSLLGEAEILPIRGVFFSGQQVRT